jgi:hypothetical protein
MAKTGTPPGPPAQPENLCVRALRTITVYESEEHLNFPWVFRGPDGFLAMNCSIGSHTKTERGMALASRDDGDTWAPPPAKQIGGMGTLLRNGRAAVLSCWGPEPDPDGSFPVSTLYYTDGGRTLQESVLGKLTLPFAMKPHFHRSIIEMPDGMLVATIYGNQEGRRKYTSALVCTKDGGKHWDLLSVMAHSEEVGSEGFCEPVLVLLANGDLLCALRVGGPLHTTRSRDGGKTWTAPVVVADHGVNPDLLLMSNGVLVLSYGRPNVELRFSDDGTGESWSPPTMVYRGPGCSYTSVRQGSNSDLLVFFSQSAFCGTPGTGPLNMIRLARYCVSRR